MEEIGYDDTRGYPGEGPAVPVKAAAKKKGRVATEQVHLLTKGYGAWTSEVEWPGMSEGGVSRLQAHACCDNDMHA